MGLKTQSTTRILKKVILSKMQILRPTLSQKLWGCIHLGFNQLSGDLSQAVRAVTTEHHRLGRLTHFFLTVLEPETSKVKVHADLDLGEGSLPGV